MVYFMSAKDYKARVIVELDKMRDRLVEMAEAIHSYNEVGYKEYETSKLLITELKRHGFEVTPNVAEMSTAFKAVYRGKEGGIKVAFLSEMDALPGLGHGCGHNIIGVASVGAGIALSKVISELNGNVMVFGTPAEEAAVDLAGGKVRMLGVIKEADVAMLVHPSDRNLVTTKNVCREALKFEFRGKAAHAGSSPHLGINALDAAMNMFNLVNSLRQHLKSDVRIHGVIVNGGSSPNVVPDYAVVKMYVRAIEKNYLDETIEKVKNCARGAALGTGTTVEISSYAMRYLNIVCNPTLSELFRMNWESLGLVVDEPPERNYGSTDMGNVSQELPSIHPYVAIAPKGTPGHSVALREAAKSKTGYDGLIFAAKGLAMTAVDLFTQPLQVRKMREDFAEFKRGKSIDY
ncbi:MAG: hypothetical protein QG670_614 [Thermoproteota archaeon]|nr:hypothetical protein [Thermoproteota archaeon]